MKERWGIGIDKYIHKTGEVLLPNNIVRKEDNELGIFLVIFGFRIRLKKRVFKSEYKFIKDGEKLGFTSKKEE